MDIHIESRPAKTLVGVLKLYGTHRLLWVRIDEFALPEQNDTFLKNKVLRVFWPKIDQTENCRSGPQVFKPPQNEPMRLLRAINVAPCPQEALGKAVCNNLEIRYCQLFLASDWLEFGKS